jgi:CheY-like chemotaxis protein
MAPFHYRILVVDDEEDICLTTKMVFESQGYEVLCAGNGVDALAMLKQSLPDIIISDLRMPTMNGFEFLSVIRRRFPQLPVIAISGEFTAAEPPDGLLADTFFEKGNYTPQDMFAEITRLLAEGPIRPHPKRFDHAPVWIQRDNRDFIAVTCTNCLRTFPVPQPLPAGAHSADCDFCSTPVKFRLSDEVVDRLQK